MRRGPFITLFGGAAAWPLTVTFISGSCGQTDVALLDADFVRTRASCMHIA
jgi:hypothetical protein